MSEDIPSFEVLPRHLAVIMDGNGRWAKARGLARSEGHIAGTEAAKTLVTECRRLGIGYVTLYTFSKENWRRPRDEVRFLFDLLVRFLNRELASLVAQDIRLNILGELDELPAAARTAVRHALKKSAGCGSMVLNFALNYSGREELLRACRRLLDEGVAPATLDEAAFSDRLYTAGQPDPDLVIRTSGELRLSNFLLWQSAYSEFYFTDTLWPDFGAPELHQALAAFASRNRRFGAAD